LLQKNYTKSRKISTTKKRQNARWLKRKWRPPIRRKRI